MTLRERIADWISGGRLKHLEKHLGAYRELTDFYKISLDRIAAEETPKANATVKRMAAIARGER